MKLTKNQAKQIRALKRMKDEDIDFTDIPEKTDWSNAAVGKFYRPVKKIADDSNVCGETKGKAEKRSGLSRQLK